MTKLISKPTASFKSWLATYLTQGQMDQFLAHHTDPLEILRIDQIKELIKQLKIDEQNTRNRYNLATKKGKRHLQVLDQERAIIQACQNAIEHARFDDLIVHQLDGSNEQTAYHVMNDNDLTTLSNSLLKYLHYHLPITYKITWILKHKTISDKTLTRRTGISPKQITSVKKNASATEDIKLSHAIRVAKHYDDVVRKNLA